MDKGEEKAKLLNAIEEIGDSLATLQNVLAIAERHLWAANRKLELVNLIIASRNETKEEKGII